MMDPHLYFHFALTELSTLDFIHKTQSRCFPQEPVRKTSHTAFTVISAKNFDLSPEQMLSDLKHQPFLFTPLLTLKESSDIKTLFFATHVKHTKNTARKS